MLIPAMPTTFAALLALLLAVPATAQTPAESPEAAAQMPAPDAPVKSDGGEGGAPEETTVSDAQRPEEGTAASDDTDAPGGETQTPAPKPRDATAN